MINYKLRETWVLHHRFLGISRGVYNPIFWLLPLASWKILQQSKNFLTSLLMLGKKYLSFTNIVVLSMPKFPPKPLLWNSLTIFSRNELRGMQKLWLLNKKPSWMWKYKYGFLSMLQGDLHFFQAFAKSSSSAYNSFIHSKPTTSTNKVFRNIIEWLNASTTLFDFPNLYSNKWVAFKKLYPFGMILI